MNRIQVVLNHLDIAPASILAAPVAADDKKSYTMEEVAKHTAETDCWIVVNGDVLNVSSFLSKHPGGKQVLLIWGGKDATTEFNMFHKKDAVKKYAPEVIIGTLAK